MKTSKLLFVISFCFFMANCGSAAQNIKSNAEDNIFPNLVINGNFEDTKDKTPVSWKAYGENKIKQELTADVGREGGFSAKLNCTEYSENTPASHAMIAQVGEVGVSKEKWYRLTFWAKGSKIAGGLQMNLSNTKSWSETGINKGFAVTEKWKKYEETFQALSDVPAEISRLQFWFKSTGTLWLDDVEFTEVKEIKPAWFPQLETKGLINYIPNSSFECGTSGWGSYSPDIQGGWTGNLAELIGKIDNTTAAHGDSSLCLDLSEKTMPVRYFDYFDPVKQKLKSILAANSGWVPMEKGKTYTLSAFMKADKPEVTGILLLHEVEGENKRNNKKKKFPLTTEWTRYSFTVKAEFDYVFAGVGVDLEGGSAANAKIWIDAVQLEKSDAPSKYDVSLPVEVGVTTEAQGNIFNPEQFPFGAPLQVRAFNNSGSARDVKIAILVKDYFDKELFKDEVNLSVKANSAASGRGQFYTEKSGFYKISYSVTGKANDLQVLRCAVLRPAVKDTRFGMNHAYPWAFLLQLAGKAGISWYRDWTVQWRTVQAEAGANFDFSKTDEQIDRVIKENGKVLVLFPFPSSIWARDMNMDPIIKEMGRPKWEEAHIRVSSKPADEQAFVKYIRESVKHYKNRVNTYQIFNESLYTTYSLPMKMGYKVEDYIHMLELAYKAVKEEQPEAVVVGGLGIWPESKLAKEFVEKGGLKYLDVLDVHYYPIPIQPEENCRPMIELWELMKERKETKPVWLTEFGCYADDDPAQFPLVFGDKTMQRSWHNTEAESSSWLVKFATLFFANGGEKIFFHAGTSGEINGVDVGGVFFKYGGEPRKILAAVSAMAWMLPVEAKFIKKESLPNNVNIYWFNTGNSELGVAWLESDDPGSFKIPSFYKVYDIMGNLVRCDDAFFTQTPVYLKRYSN